MVLLAAVVAKEIYFLEGKFALVFCLYTLAHACLSCQGGLSEVCDVFCPSVCSYAHSAYVYQNYLTGCYPKEVIISTNYSSFCVSQMAYK